MKFVSVQEMISIEKAADAAGHSYEAMMEAAGKGVADEVQSNFGHIPGRVVTALVGSGNNGGDALVALDYLQSRGWKSTALICRKRLEFDPLTKRFEDNGGRLVDWWTGEQQNTDIDREIITADLLLDGVLGTGIKLPLKDPIKTLLEKIKDRLEHATDKPIIVAVDCPSGIDCNTGQVDPACIPADLTVTMAAIKKGLFEFPAYQYLGDLRLVDIGLPEELPELKKITREMITRDWVKAILPARPPDGHKGMFGTTLIIGGSVNYPGAAILAGESAYHSGAGLVTIAVPSVIYEGVIGTLPEATWIKLDDLNGAISESALSQIASSLERPTACLVGPGLGLEITTAEFLEGFFLLDSLPPIVLDADGLTLARGLKRWPGILPEGSILTPHPGEMAVLTGKTVKEVQADRIGFAEKYSRDWNQVVLLKGAHTVIAEPEGKTRIYQGAEPALARAGSGDVLAGIIAGLTAQGLSPFDAAAAGVWLHGEAGRQAEKNTGSPAAVLAGDISRAIGEIMPD